MEDACCYFLHAGSTMQVRKKDAMLGLGPGTQQVAATVGKPNVVVVTAGSEAGQTVGCGTRLAVEIRP